MDGFGSEKQCFF